jgi:hypothetical protein
MYVTVYFAHILEINAHMHAIPADIPTTVQFTEDIARFHWKNDSKDIAM